jgi:hypothetical protein
LRPSGPFFRGINATSENAAESTTHEKFKNYKIVLDEPEEGNNVDLAF